MHNYEHIRIVESGFFLAGLCALLKQIIVLVVKVVQSSCVIIFTCIFSEEKAILQKSKPS